MSEEDRKKVVEDIKRANYFWVILPPLIGLISNFFRTQRWRLLLQPVGYYPGFWNTFHSVMVMYFANLFFPRAGEVLRCGILSRYEKVPLDKSIGTMVVERVMDVICLGLLSLFLLIAERDVFLALYRKMVQDAQATFGDIIGKYQLRPAIKYGVLATILVIFLVFLVNQIKSKGWSNIIASAKDKLLGLYKGVISVKDLKNPFAFLFHTAMIWATYVIMGYVSFKTFPETAHLGLMTAGVMLFFSGVAFSLTPGGLGLYPIFFALVLEAYGIAGSVVNSLGLVVWTAQTVSVLAMGVISLLILAIINRQPALEKEPLKS